MTNETDGTYVNPQKVDLVRLKQKLSPIKKTVYATNSESETFSPSKDKKSSNSIVGITVSGTNSMSLSKGPARRSSASPIKSVKSKHQLEHGQPSSAENHTRKSILKPFDTNTNILKNRSIFHDTSSSADFSPIHKNTPNSKKMENSIFSGLFASPATRRIESMLLQSKSSVSKLTANEMERTKEDLFEFTMSVDRKKTLRRIRSITDTLEDEDNSYDSFGETNTFKKMKSLGSSNHEVNHKNKGNNEAISVKKSLDRNYNEKRRKIKDDLDIGVKTHVLREKFLNFPQITKRDDMIDQQFRVKNDAESTENKSGITTLSGSPISRISHIHEKDDLKDFEVEDSKNIGRSNFLRQMKYTINKNSLAGVPKKEQELKSCLKQRHDPRIADSNLKINDYLNDGGKNARSKYVTFSSEIEELQADNTVTRSRRLPKSVESENEDYLTDNDIEEDKDDIRHVAIGDAISYADAKTSSADSQREISAGKDIGKESGTIDSELWRDLSGRQSQILRELNMINVQIRNFEKIQKSILLESMQISEVLARHEKKRKRKKDEKSRK